MIINYKIRQLKRQTVKNKNVRDLSKADVLKFKVNKDHDDEDVNFRNLHLPESSTKIFRLSIHSKLSGIPGSCCCLVISLPSLPSIQVSSSNENIHTLYFKESKNNQFNVGLKLKGCSQIEITGISCESIEEPNAFHVERSAEVIEQINRVELSGQYNNLDMNDLRLLSKIYTTEFVSKESGDRLINEILINTNKRTRVNIQSELAHVKEDCDSIIAYEHGQKAMDDIGTLAIHIDGLENKKCMLEDLTTHLKVELAKIDQEHRKTIELINTLEQQRDELSSKQSSASTFEYEDNGEGGLNSHQLSTFMLDKILLRLC